MFKIGDLAVYDNGVDLHAVTITAYFPDTDEYEVEFCLRTLYPRRMVVHERSLDDLIPGDKNKFAKNCECGAWKTYGKDCAKYYHGFSCPINYEKGKYNG